MEINSETIDKLNLLNKPAIIGVSGFGGSGKSTLAGQLGEILNAPVVCIDSFIKKERPILYSNWEIMDFERLKRDVILPFKKGENPLIFRPSRWESDIVLDKISIEHEGILVIEGVGIFQPSLMDYFSYTFWIDTPAEEALRRGKKRDKEVYKRPQDEQWNGLWKNNDRQFYEKFKPDKLATQVISNN